MKGVIETLLPLLLVPALSFSESSQSSWDDLKQLAAGQQIRIVLYDAKSYDAKFQSVPTMQYWFVWRRAIRYLGGTTFCVSPREAKDIAAGTR